MAILKMQMPDPNDHRRNKKIASTGAPGRGMKKATYAKGGTASIPITRNAQFAGSGASVTMTQPMFFSPLHTPQNWQIASKRREIYQWARFYYENEPKVAAGIDFYSNFPMNGFVLECPNTKVLEFYDHLVETLELNKWLSYISHEYFLLGEVFPFLEIHCPECGMQPQGPNEEPCNHPGGTFTSIRVMNPDYIEVQDNVLAEEPVISMLADEELKMIIQRKEPRQIYDNLPQWLIEMVSSGQPFPLSPRSVSHLKYNSSPYQSYGTSMLRRLFTILAYKTKLMTANWIIAERLILPVRVVKIGEEKRPASEEDIQDVVNQLAAVANDPNLTIVTHHAFDYEWYGATGKIHNLNNEMEEIGKEILDGLMINQAILNGEMAGYNSAQVGVEIMIRRLENWRNSLTDWIETKIFKPVAMMQGFVDEAKTKRTGRTQYLYPKVKFNDMNLRDNTNKVQTLLQVYDKQGVSMQTILQELDLDYDTEVERMRQENIVASQGGLMAPAGGEMGGMGGPMGGDMGGMGGGEMGDPMADPMAGGMPGAEMGGMPGADMMGGGGGEMGAAAESQPKVMKRGKGGKSEEEEEVIPPKLMKLTKLESAMFNELQNLKVPYDLYGQYQVKVAGEQQPFVLDFAYPQLGVAIETDGAIWHERTDLKERDAIRDQKLAGLGWKIMRFSEEAVFEHIDAVRDVVYQHIVEAAKSKKGEKKKAQSFYGNIIKKAERKFEAGAFSKYASIEDSSMSDRIVQDSILEKESNGRITLSASLTNDSFYIDYIKILGELENE